MKLTPRRFRLLMIAALVLSITGALVDAIFPGLVPAPIREAEVRLAEAAIEDPPLLAGAAMLLLLIGAIVAFVGLYRFKAWARPLNLGLCASGFVLGPLIGHTLTSGWALPFMETSQMLWGAVTALSYVTPLAAEFES